MRIAVYAGFLNPDKNTWRGRDWFVYETLKRISTSHPEHEFLLLFDGTDPLQHFDTTGVKQIALGPKPQNVIALRRRVNRKLLALLKQHHADVLLSMAGLLPIRNKIPTCLVVQDLSFTLETPRRMSLRSRYLRRHFPQYLQKADTIATVSHFCKKELISRFQLPEEKITVVHKGVHENFRPLNWEEREEVKNEVTDEREYFIYVGTIHSGKNIINLLKAFSILKKKFRSNMMLVLAGALDPGYKKFPELLRTYHFRKDVKCLGPVGQPDLARLVGAAYSLICPSVGEGFGSPLLEALECRIPPLAAEHSAFEEVGEDAAFYFNPSSFEEMGEKLCEIFKDEDLRAALIAKADAQVAKFSWDQTADKLWSSLLLAASAKEK